MWLMFLMVGAGFACLKDDITFRIWQPLPPVILNENGTMLQGSNQCGDREDLRPCWIQGCRTEYDSVENTVEDSVENNVEDSVENNVEDSVENNVEDSVENSVEDSKVACTDYACWKGFCFNSKEREAYIEPVEFSSNISTTSTTSTSTTSTTSTSTTSTASTT